MSGPVEYGAEAMLETDLGKMILARHEAKTLLVAGFVGIEKAGYRIVPVACSDALECEIMKLGNFAWPDKVWEQLLDTAAPKGTY